MRNPYFSFPGSDRALSGTSNGKCGGHQAVRAIHLGHRLAGLHRLKMQHRLAFDSAAIKFASYLRDLLIGSLDLGMKSPGRDHRNEPGQSFGGETMRKLVKRDKP